MSLIKVMIVEDEEDARSALVRMLGRRGVEGIIETSKGAEAIQLIEKEKPDVAFLDIQLGDSIDGMEVLKQAKVKSPQTEIIMMSAHKEEYEDEAKKLGAFNFIRKPILKIEELANLIEEVRKIKNLA